MCWTISFFHLERVDSRLLVDWVVLARRVFDSFIGVLFPGLLKLFTRLFRNAKSVMEGLLWRRKGLLKDGVVEHAGVLFEQELWIIIY